MELPSYVKDQIRARITNARRGPVVYLHRNAMTNAGGRPIDARRARQIGENMYKFGVREHEPAIAVNEDGLHALLGGNHREYAAYGFGFSSRLPVQLLDLSGIVDDKGVPVSRKTHAGVLIELIEESEARPQSFGFVENLHTFRDVWEVISDKRTKRGKPATTFPEFRSAHARMHRLPPLVDLWPRHLATEDVRDFHTQSYRGMAKLASLSERHWAGLLFCARRGYISMRGSDVRSLGRRNPPTHLLELVVDRVVADAKDWVVDTPPCRFTKATIDALSGTGAVSKKPKQGQKTNKKSASGQKKNSASGQKKKTKVTGKRGRDGKHKKPEETCSEYTDSEGEQCGDVSDEMEGDNVDEEVVAPSKRRNTEEPRGDGSDVHDDHEHHDGNDEDLDGNERGDDNENEADEHEDGDVVDEEDVAPSKRLKTEEPASAPSGKTRASATSNPGRGRGGRGRGRGSSNAGQRAESNCGDERVTVIDDTTVEIILKRREKVAAKCPCEQEDCGTLMAVGKYAHLGTGHHNCPHCGFIPKNGFNGVAELKGHLNTNTCRSKRGLAHLPSAKQVLGPVLCHRIDDPDYQTEENGVAKFKCFACGQKVNHRTRLEHCKECFPNNNILLPVLPTSLSTTPPL